MSTGQRTGQVRVSSSIWAARTCREDPDDMRDERGAFFTTEELADEYARRLAELEGRDEVDVWEIQVLAELPEPSIWYELQWFPRADEIRDRGTRANVDGEDPYSVDPYVRIAPDRNPHERYNPWGQEPGSIIVYSKDRELAMSKMEELVAAKKSGRNIYAEWVATINE